MLTIEEYLQKNFPDRSIIDSLYVYDANNELTTAPGSAIFQRVQVTQYNRTPIVDIEFYL